MADAIALSALRLLGIIMATRLLLELTTLYQQSHRHYHSLPHIADMLHQGRHLTLDEVQVMAIWFHDAIYDPRSKTNEEDSAALAGDRLRAAGWVTRDVERVQRIVLDTKLHHPTTAGADVVLDLDLMSLAVEWPQFAANTLSIRAEYAHVSDSDFAAGRTAFFANMLQRERLFYSPFGQTLEARARANLRRASRS